MMRKSMALVSIAALPPFTAARILDVRHYGAVSDNETDCTAAFRLCTSSATEGDTVYVGALAGRQELMAIYATGPFNLSSGVTLHVEDGAMIRGLPDASVYPFVAPMPSYGGSRDYAGDPHSPDGGRWMRYHPLVWAVDAVGVKITGGGVIEGSGSYWKAKYRANTLLAGRPHLVEFRNCTDIEVTGVTIQNSGFWSLHILYSRGAWIHDTRVLTPWGSINGDGIDPDSSSDVLIERCYIATGDDHIAIKSGLDEAGRTVGLPSRNITIRDCVLGHGRGIAIGSEVSGGVEDVFVSNVSIEENRTEGPGWGFYIKSAASRGGYIRRITYENSLLEAVQGTAFSIWTSYPSDHDAPVPWYKLTDIRDITYRNIMALSSEKAGDFECWGERHCQNVTLTNVTILADDDVTWACSNITGSAVGVSPPLQDCFDTEPGVDMTLFV